MQLVGNSSEVIFPISLGLKTAVAIATAELFELVIEFSHCVIAVSCTDPPTRLAKQRTLMRIDHRILNTRTHVCLITDDADGPFGDAICDTMRHYRRDVEEPKFFGNCRLEKRLKHLN